MNKLLIFILLVWAAPCAQAQQPDPVESLVRLNTFLEKSENIGFDITYYFEEDDSSGVQRDTLSGTGRISAGRSWMQLGGMKKINNDYYYVLLDTVNKELFVSNPQPPAKQFNVREFTDSVFVAAYIDSLSAKDSAGYTIVRVAFKPAAQYNSYELMYTTNTLKPAVISYRVKKDDAAAGAAAEIRMRIVFSNFNTDRVDESLFSTKGFFTRQNGVFVLQPGYTDYQLIDMTGG